MRVRHWEEANEVFAIRYTERQINNNVATFKFYEKDYYDALKQKLFGF